MYVILINLWISKSKMFLSVGHLDMSFEELDFQSL